MQTQKSVLAGSGHVRTRDRGEALFNHASDRGRVCPITCQAGVGPVQSSVRLYSTMFSQYGPFAPDCLLSVITLLTSHFLITRSANANNDRNSVNTGTPNSHSLPFVFL
uniref:Uncharacterized protein n=1 Tax=Anguilla anguilla TaxID=7936 RepID=A0A0E9WV91_ANGAN